MMNSLIKSFAHALLSLALTGAVAWVALFTGNTVVAVISILLLTMFLSMSISVNTRLPLRRIYPAVLTAALTPVLLTWIIICPLAKFLISSTMPAIIFGAATIISAYTIPAIKATARQYGNAMKFHSQEYYYMLGNGISKNSALQDIESRTWRTAIVLLARQLSAYNFGILAISFATMLLLGMSVFKAIATELIIIILIPCSVLLSTLALLLTARKTMFDSFDNKKEK